MKPRHKTIVAQDRRRNPPGKPPCSDYRARVAAGLCCQCDNQAVTGTPFCPKHRVSERERARKNKGYKRRYPNAKSYQK